MSNNNDNAEVTEKAKRIHDQAPSDLFADFMRSGWAPSDYADLAPLEVVTYAFARRQVLSAAYPGIRLVLPAGGYKVRSNDTDYQYRPHSAFAYYSGVQGADSTADAVLVMEPTQGGHLTYLYIHPRSTRDTDAFYRDAKYGELWVGRRYTLDEAKARYQIDTRLVNDLEAFLKDGKETLIIRGEDAMVDGAVKKHDRESEFLTFTSEQRLVKDDYEIAEMQKAVDASALGFNDVISVMPAAVATPRGERVLEAAFYGRARVLGNDLGYNTIVGAGAHACVLHWIRNDGDVRRGELVLVDAGVEVESLYTADVTRTLPVSGKFTDIQRKIYDAVLEAADAAFKVAKPGVKFSDIHQAAMNVIAKKTAEWGLIGITAEESLKQDVQLHRRWMVHGTSHHLGMDVHDCGQARREMYMDGILQPGMIFTIEPGLYFHENDLSVPKEYRGIGVRIEDDVLVTKNGVENLTAALPREAKAVEKWLAKLK